jgi:ABC-type amino acid transport substrate-binding protein
MLVRDASRWQPCLWVAIGTVLVAVSLVVFGCGRGQEPPVLLGFDPPSPAVAVGGSIYIRLTYEQKDARLYEFSWTVEAGTIIGNGLSAVTYEAPDTPGTYRFSVTLPYGGGRQTVSLDGTVTVLAAPALTTASDVAARGRKGDVAHVSTPSSIIAKIRQQGRFTAAVYEDFSPFSFVDADGKRVGFDVDVMREFARRWIGDAHAVRLVPVVADDRIAALRQGKADIIAAALTNTPARQEQIAFSHTYFQDGQRLLVPERDQVADLCDLQGKTVVVTRGSTAVHNVQERAAECGFAVDLIYADTHPQAVQAVLSGEADAFSTDGLALQQFARNKPLKVVGNHFSEEPYGLGLAQGDETFRHLVNLTLEVMYADGTLAAIYQKWFQDSLRPYPIPALVKTAADPELLKLATTDAPPLFVPMPVSPPVSKEYVVQKGDTLSHIAGKFYGDVSPRSWTRIYNANKAVIGANPSRIRIGMRLTIPEP